MAVWRHVCILSCSSYIIIPVLILLFALEGCSKNKILNEDKFMKAYVDLIITQDTANVPIAKFDSVKALVFKRNGITSEEFNSTIKYYNRNPQKWQDFFRKATSYVNELRSQSQSKQIQIKK